MSYLGRSDFRTNGKLGLFVSAKIPGSLILKIFDAAASIRDAGLHVIGGFHSKTEKECLKILLRGTQPVTVCPARSIKGYRYPKEWKGPIADGRLRLLSDFPDHIDRITAESAEQRNRYVVSLVNAVFIPYAGPGSKTEALAREIAATDKPLFTIIVPETANLQAIGARDVFEFSW